MIKQYKVVFFGTPELAVPFLDALTKSHKFEVLSVVTQPDKPIGRKQQLSPPPIKLLANELNIPCLQFASLKNEDAINVLSDLNADLFIVIAYGKMIPEAILNMPRFGCVNVHPSLLPKYRGPSPIQSAIVNADDETGISIMLLDSGMDTGPVLSQKTIHLDPRETTLSLSKKIMEVGPEFLIETLGLYVSNVISPRVQDDSKATISKKLDRDDGLISWDLSDIEIDRMIRAYSPWPGCYFEFNHRGKKIRVKLLSAEITSDNKLNILEVQPEGKKPMGVQEFERGYGPLRQ